MKNFLLSEFNYNIEMSEKTFPCWHSFWAKGSNLLASSTELESGI